MTGPGRIGECLLAVKNDDQRVGSDEAGGKDHDKVVHDFLFVRRNRRRGRLLVSTLSAAGGARLARAGVLAVFVSSYRVVVGKTGIDFLRSGGQAQRKLVQKRQSESSHARHPNQAGEARLGVPWDLLGVFWLRKL